MTKEYEPTKKEVLSEMWNGIRNKFTKENVSKVGKSLKDFGACAGGIAGVMLAIPYIIPTTVRDFRNSNGDTGGNSLAQNIGGYTGVFSGLVADIGQVLGYSYAVKENHPEFLLIPIATNAASGAYEIGRKMYFNAKKRVLENYNSKDLEATLKAEEQVKE